MSVVFVHDMLDRFLHLIFRQPGEGDDICNGSLIPVSLKSIHDGCLDLLSIVFVDLFFPA